MLQWNVTLPNEETFTISYDHTSRVQNIQSFRDNVQSILTKYEASGYMESLLILTLNNSIIGPDVQCIVNDFPAVEITLPVAQGI